MWWRRRLEGETKTITSPTSGLNAEKGRSYYRAIREKSGSALKKADLVLASTRVYIILLSVSRPLTQADYHSNHKTHTQPAIRLHPDNTSPP